MKFFYGKQYINSKDQKKVLEVLKSNYLTQGPKIDIFEKKLINKFGSKYSIAVSSGSAALHLVAKALNWSKKDTILTSPITFVSTANCIEHVGAKTDFVDIDKDTYTIDPNRLEDKCKKAKKRGSKFKAVIAIDYAGHPCDWQSLKYLSNKYKFQLINDNCHAIGAKYKKMSNYAAKYALAVTHSYHPVKNITTGEGGSVLTNDKILNNKIRLLRSHGMLRNDPKKPWFYSVDDIGFNYRITDMQSALGISQLSQLSKFINKRNTIASYYMSYFKNNEKIKLPIERKDIKHAYHLFPILLNLKKIKKTKSEIFKDLRKKNIFLQVHYIPVHMHSYYKKKYGFKKGDFPISEDFYEREVSLPIYFDLNLKNQRYLCKTIEKIL